MPVGTIVNVIAVVIGSLLGLLLRRSLPERIRGMVFQAIGLFTIVYGVMMALKLAEGVEHGLALVFSLLIGGILGEWWRLETRLEQLGDRLKARVRGAGERFTEGLVTAFLIFCIGPMTILGSLDDGLRGSHELLFTKSLLDGFMSIALASTYGIGVLFCALPLFIFQYGITLIGLVARDALTEVMIAQLTAVGGVLICGLGFNLLGFKPSTGERLRITNLLPALAVIVILTLIFG